MKPYWAKHQGRTRWGVRTQLDKADELYVSEGGNLFIWSDVVEVRDGCLLFRADDGAVRCALAPGRWEAVFEAAPDDTPQSVETR